MMYLVKSTALLIFQPSDCHRSFVAPGTGEAPNVVCPVIVSVRGVNVRVMHHVDRPGNVDQVSDLWGGMYLVMAIMCVVGGRTKPGKRSTTLECSTHRETPAQGSRGAVAPPLSSFDAIDILGEGEGVVSRMEEGERRKEKGGLFGWKGQLH
jgi:hypothetical protein